MGGDDDVFAEDAADDMAAGADPGPSADRRGALDDDKRSHHGVGSDADLFVDPGGRRVDQEDAGLHQGGVDPIAQPGSRAGQIEARLHAEDVLRGRRHEGFDAAAGPEDRTEGRREARTPDCGAIPGRR